MWNLKINLGTIFWHIFTWHPIKLKIKFPDNWYLSICWVTRPKNGDILMGGSDTLSIHWHHEQGQHHDEQGRWGLQAWSHIRSSDQSTNTYGDVIISHQVRRKSLESPPTTPRVNKAPIMSWIYIFVKTKIFFGFVWRTFTNLICSPSQLFTQSHLIMVSYQVNAPLKLSFDILQFGESNTKKICTDIWL